MYNFVSLRILNNMRFLITLLLVIYNSLVFGQSKALVFQSDFGLKDGAVAAMKGVAYSVDSDLKLFDITHEIPVYNIWEAAYRLRQSAPYWPSGTVFVSVVDPGVGSERKSVVMKTRSGHFFVTPDNGTLTLVGELLGIDQVREIDEATNRLKNSSQSYTFHGRDVYAFTGARLAAGIISFEQVGKLLTSEIVRIDYQKAVIEKLDGKPARISGTIDILDIQFGNLWTNIDRKTFEQLNIKYGDKLHVTISQNTKTIFEGDVVYAKIFADVPKGKPLAFMNSLSNFALGINQGNFATQFKVGSGATWKIVLSK